METAAAGASGQYWIRKVWETRHVHLELKVTVLDYKLMSDVRGKEGGGGRFEPWWGDKSGVLGKTFTLNIPVSNKEYKWVQANCQGRCDKILGGNLQLSSILSRENYMNPCILEPITHSSYVCLYKICCPPSLRFWNLLHPIAVPDLLLFNRSVYYLSFLPFILLTSTL